MEVNKDESERCVDLAEEQIKLKNREKAEKFLHKAERLYPSQRAKDLLTQIKLVAPSQEPETQQSRKRKVTIKPEEPKEPQYTNDQLKAVKRIKTCKDYYEILGVNKDVTDSDIKKAYKKLALQLHPDKNNCPGAAEAFKALGNAVAVLTVPKKRKQYDLNGSKKKRVSRSHGHHSYTSYSRGFESVVTACSSFDLFINSRFGNFNVFVRRNGRGYRQNMRSSRWHHSHQR